MEPRSVERLILASIKGIEDVTLLRTKYNISENEFVFFPEEAAFVFEQVVQFNKPPDVALMKAQFPKSDVLESEPTENFEGAAYDLSNVVIDRLASNSIRAFMGSPGGPGPMEKDARGTFPLFVRSLTSIERNYVNTDTGKLSVLDSANAKDRLREYLDRVANKDKYRIRLGIEPLDRIPLYIAPGMLLGLFANTKVGKSFFATRIAAEVFRQGYKVVFISPEFTLRDNKLRADVILAKLMGFELDHYALTIGDDPPGLAKQYELFLDKVGNEAEDRFQHFDSIPNQPLTLTGIADIIRQERPFFLVVDSILQVKDEGGYKSSWEAMHAKTYGLHDLANQNNMIILVTNQGGRGSSEYDGPAELKDVAHGYDFARGVDLLLSFGKIKDEPDIRQVRVVAQRTGKELPENYSLVYKPNIGDIGREFTSSPDPSIVDKYVGDK